ncbi:transposase [Streptomyces misionensis]|uniref:transposase n=1 Tax=Streptomyces misionensis TaxID=67331 RepID=UPI0037011686
MPGEVRRLLGAGDVRHYWVDVQPSAAQFLGTPLTAPGVTRTDQQTPEWKARYAVRSGVEGTVNEFAHGHGMRRCRYRGQGKAHIQHVLTAIAANIERPSGLAPAEEAPTPRQPTDFQNYLDRRETPRVQSRRTLGS